MAPAQPGGTSSKGTKRRRGRGRRAPSIQPLVRSRIILLLEQARSAARRGAWEDSDRYVDLILRLATRYNVRLAPDQRALICRTCRRYLYGSGRVRVRLRATVVRTCRSCGTVVRHGGVGRRGPRRRASSKARA